MFQVTYSYFRIKLVQDHPDLPASESPILLKICWLDTGLDIGRRLGEAEPISPALTLRSDCDENLKVWYKDDTLEI